MLRTLQPVLPPHDRRCGVSGRGARQPVLYMDIDDTLLRYPGGAEGPVPAPGAVEFVAWAFEHFEVRWLTRWCRNGRMSDDLVRSFCKMFRVDAKVVQRVKGLDWSETDNKLDGITWLEHVVLERPFLWIEDEHGLGEIEQGFLTDHGFAEMWLSCNVTMDPHALSALHQRLLEEGWVGGLVVTPQAS